MIPMFQGRISINQMKKRTVRCTQNKFLHIVKPGLFVGNIDIVMHDIRLIMCPQKTVVLLYERMKYPFYAFTTGKVSHKQGVIRLAWKYKK